MLGRVLLIVVMSVVSVAVVHAADTKAPAPPPSQKPIEKETCTTAVPILKLTPGREKEKTPDGTKTKEKGPVKISVTPGSQRDIIKGQECPQGYCTVVWKELVKSSFQYQPKRACIKQGESVYIGEGVATGAQAVLTDDLENRVAKLEERLGKGYLSPSAPLPSSEKIQNAFAADNIDKEYAEQLKPVADARKETALKTLEYLPDSKDAKDAAGRFTALSDALSDSKNLTPSSLNSEKITGEKTILSPTPSDTFKKDADKSSADLQAPQTGNVVTDALRRWGKTAMDYAVDGVERFEQWLGSDEAVDPDAPFNNYTEIPKTIPLTEKEQEESWAYQDELAKENWERGQQFEIQQAQEASKKAALEYQMEEERLEASLASKNAAALYQWEDERWDEMYASQNAKAVERWEEAEIQKQVDWEFAQEQEEIRLATELADKELDAYQKEADALATSIEKKVEDQMALREMQLYYESQEKAAADAYEFSQKVAKDYAEAEPQAPEREWGPWEMQPGGYMLQKSDDGFCKAADGYVRTCPDPFASFLKTQEAPPTNFNEQLTAGQAVNLGEQQVGFDFGKSKIRPGTDEQILNDLGNALSRPEYQDHIFIFTGHTDAVGSFEANRVLSRQRAEATAAFLVQGGYIRADQVIIFDMGETIANQAPRPRSGEHRRVQVLPVPRLGP